MEEHKYTSNTCKGSSSICYSIGCNNPATRTVKLPLDQKICCIIKVCDSCLSKYSIQSWPLKGDNIVK